MTISFKLNRKGVRELLRSQEVRADLERRARKVATKAGPGHRVESSIGRNRARASVITDTAEARIAEGKDRNLTSSLDAGRD